MKDEVQAAIRKMKTGKATGSDGISVELIEALGDYGVDKVTTLLNEIYDTGQIPTDMSRSKETRSDRMRASPHYQPYEPCH
ncbi:endonuclease-reverse transcriptase [Plakobranchus ocellatus]|uniref:Endonuclease-reverse transcriptase n=1 Tax=Plakobranchus ocellatus TaxID=259542 RepID=A0AAV4BG08_9GAST|nr:endonuclease-reverse transcriptase [Plakobranchus ocellatus]